MEVAASHIHTPISRYITLDTSNNLSSSKIRGYHPLRHYVPVNFFSKKKDLRQSHHISLFSRKRIQFVLCSFRSPLLRASLLISFPPPTKMFQFSGFLFSKENICQSISEVRFGNLWFKGYLHLPRAFRSLPRPSSAPKPSPPARGLTFYMCTTPSTELL